MHKKTLLLLLAVAIVFDFTGCVSMSPQARRERAYRHYVQKQIKHRQREIARAQKAANRQLKQKMKLAKPSEPQVTTSIEAAPDSRPDPMTEPTADPITVSASGSIPTDNTIEPTQP